jgi:hypothetical protein
MATTYTAMFGGEAGYGVMSAGTGREGDGADSRPRHAADHKRVVLPESSPDE